jgi:integrase/recombinase XerC/integrase/recombinase XerD
MHRKIIDKPVLMEHYEIHNRTEGKSPRTVEWYNLVLGQLCDWLECRGTPTTLEHVDEMMIRRFILFLQEKPGRKAKTMSTNTMYNRVNALRSFFGWLHRQGYTDEHVLQNLKQPKTTDLVIELLNREEINRIMDTINPRTALGARNTALVTIMLGTGFRISELASLKDRDVHIEGQYLKVMGKESKKRVVAFGVACRKALFQYRQRFRGEPAHRGVDTFFLSIDGYPVTADSLKSLIKRLSKSSGVNRLHPHLLRHTYATMFLLKQNLGHSTLAMVERYLHIAAQTAAIRRCRVTASSLTHSTAILKERGRFASTPTPEKGADERTGLGPTYQAYRGEACGPSGPGAAPPPSPLRRRGA